MHQLFVLVPTNLSECDEVGTLQHQVRTAFQLRSRVQQRETEKCELLILEEGVTFLVFSSFLKNSLSLLIFFVRREQFEFKRNIVLSTGKHCF